MSEVTVKLSHPARGVYEIYGIVNGRFVKRQYIGYSKKQAIQKFTESVQKGKI